MQNTPPTKTQFNTDSLTVLQVFQITGLADMKQIQAATGLTRDRINRILERLCSEGAVQKFSRNLPRPGQTGMPAAIYLLTERGAQKLKGAGFSKASASGLVDDQPIQHARAMVDFHLAAERAGVSLVTDQEIRAAGQILRPDHQVSLPDGRLLFFEIEQAASSENLRRVADSLRHKRAFFSEKSHVLPEVRLLINLPPGKPFGQTERTWQNGLGAVFESDKPTFRLFAMPLREFFDHPDWGLERSAAWHEITPGETDAPLAVASRPAPEALFYNTPGEERVVLAALWQDFLENTQRPDFGPSPEFLLNLRLIYAASHDPAQTAIELAALPHASLYLLNAYLTMRNLRPKLQKALHNRANQSWSTQSILHRMQVVIDTFFAAHGWRTDGPLTVSAVTSNWNNFGPHKFDVLVSINNPELLMTNDEIIVPTRTEVTRTEQALGWVLWALFAHSAELGLSKPEFW